MAGGLSDGGGGLPAVSGDAAVQEACRRPVRESEARSSPHQLVVLWQRSDDNDTELARALRACHLAATCAREFALNGAFASLSSAAG